MPKFSLCVVCAILTTMFALLLLLSPSPAVAQDVPADNGRVALGDGDESVGAVVCTVKMLGSDKTLDEFKLMVQGVMGAGAIVNKTVWTDADGKLEIDLREMPGQLRVFAYGDYVIPEGWSNVPVASFDFSVDEKPAWDLFVRPLRNVRVTGRITIDGRESPAERANVAFAPLDVAQDGSFRMFDAPIGVLTDKEGKYEVKLPTGYYQVWSYWADRGKEKWTGFIQVENRRGIFEDTTLDLALEEGPHIEGRVIDARTGEGVSASINLYTNQYLRQLRNYTSDGRYPDEEIDGEEIFWPVGTFKFQAWMMNPHDFSVVIRPEDDKGVLKVIPGLSVEDVTGKQLEWKLYTEDARKVDVKVTTHEHDMPVNELDVTVLPRQLDAPEHLAPSYQAGTTTGYDGVAGFMGLAPGTYEVYGWRGEMFLGEIEVGEELRQSHTVHLEIPFAYGTIKLPDGEVCKNMVAWVWVTNKAGQSFGPFDHDAFRENPLLKDQGRVFVPLLSPGSTMRIKFAAMKEGREFTEDEWLKIEHFELVTDAFQVTVESEKAWELDMTLKENPNYTPYQRDED